MKTSAIHLSLLLILELVICSCNNQHNTKQEETTKPLTEFDINAAKAKIQEQTKLFTEAHLSKDTAYLNNIFTGDARVFAPNAAVVTGTSAISQLNYDWVNYGIYEFNEVSTSFYGNEDYLIDEGTYYLRYGAENTVDKGKYINIWKNINGEWKIYSNIWNTDLP